MAVEFKDYYKILGVSKDASQDEIKSAYRKLARKHHPDLNKAAGSEAKFKDINEAHEVLADPEKRKKYDQFGNNWQQGDHFRPPPDWEQTHGYRANTGNQKESFFWSSEDGEYSDFFEALFGGEPFQTGSGSRRNRDSFAGRKQGVDHEATLRISLEEAFRGAIQSITLHAEDSAVGDSREKHYDVKIPAGILPGQKIRLQGQGGRGRGGSGDLYLNIEILPHPNFKLEGRDLTTELAITPWEAALGTRIEMPTLSGFVTLKVPAGTQSGQKLRLTGKGMPNPKGLSGDLYALIQIKVPQHLSQKEKALFKELQNSSSFNPRA